MVSGSSRRAYNNLVSRFVTFLLANHQELLNEGFIDLLGDLGTLSITEIRKKIQGLIEEDYQPINLELLTDDHFLDWLAILKKKDGSEIGFSDMNSHRRAFSDLYRRAEVDMPPSIVKALTRHFRGLGGTIARESQDGRRDILTGKIPAPMELYKFLGAFSLKFTTVEKVFFRCFMILSWNLFCRASNTVGIKLSHLSWSQDSMLIYFAHMKNDQDGSRPRDPRHCYANRSDPSICPVLAIAIYFSVCGFDESGSLFPGSAQYDRFRKILDRIMNED